MSWTGRDSLGQGGASAGTGVVYGAGLKGVVARALQSV